ncbi:DUF4198 domain-containing protein [Ottowia sp.]|uniref:DUF4198 domain-containing protein n=1 Tax=Ottowia sp. TaxID=1898956 RepID=UPI0025ECF762|nr:DUF4198 domain-containing protein [Ottowia sp.]MBK6747329.1 DUF4198 domain-containing protein [Ottowia sp.]
MRIAYRLTFCAAALCGLLSHAQAHNVWLKPSSTVLSKAEWITVDAAVSNDLFFFNHFPLNIEKLAVTAPDGGTVQPENVSRGKLRTVFDLNLTQPGTYRLAVANASLNASYKDRATGQTKRWRGTPDKLAAEVPADAVDLAVTESVSRIETFVTVGKPSALQPINHGLELVPVTSPADLVQGEKATFVLHVDGKPAPGIEVEVIADGTRYRNQTDPVKATTDAQGRFSVTWPAAGLYWIEVSAKDGKTSAAPAKERRLSYVATVEVLP